MDDYEADERFTLEFVEPLQAIATNREENHGSVDSVMLEREAKVLEFLIREGCLNENKD